MRDKFQGAFQPFVPYLFRDEELAAFVVAADNLAPHKLSLYRPYIVAILFRLLYCCGLRPQEVRMIHCADVNGEAGSIYLRDTKVHRDRLVGMSPDMQALCRRYDATMRTILNDREYYFPNLQGGPYSANWVQQQFRHCWKQAGLAHWGATVPRVYDFRYPNPNEIPTLFRKPCQLNCSNQKRFGFCYCGVCSVCRMQEHSPS